MKIVIKDANVIIDLIKLDLIHAFFKLPFDIHTTRSIVEDELYSTQLALLHDDIHKGNLTLQDFSGEEMIKISNIQIDNPGLSLYDCGAYYCAQKLEACLLTSDKRLRNLAKSNKLEYHGHLWILDEMVGHNIINGSTAIKKLEKLQQINPNLGLPKRSCEKMKKKWLCS